MALSKTITTQVYGQPVVVPNTYIKVTSVSATKDTANACVSTYTADKSTVISQAQYTFTPSVAEGSANFIKQAYEYLKTLPDFAGATDVLEAGQTP